MTNMSLSDKDTRNKEEKKQKGTKNKRGRGKEESNNLQNF